MLFLIISFVFGMTKVKTGKRRVLIEPGCNILKIQSNYQAISIDVRSDPYAVKLISFKSTEEHGCSLDCPSSSDICSNQELPSETSMKIDICVSDIYLHVKSVVASSISIEFNYLGSCSKGNRNSYSICGSLSSHECGFCNEGCRLAVCVNEDEKTGRLKILDHICLPNDVNSAEMSLRCQGYLNVHYGLWKPCQKKEDKYSFNLLYIIAILCTCTLIIGICAFIIIKKYLIKKARSQRLCYWCCPKRFISNNLADPISNLNEIELNNK